MKIRLALKIQKEYQQYLIGRNHPWTVTTKRTRWETIWRSERRIRMSIKNTSTPLILRVIGDVMLKRRLRNISGAMVESVLAEMDKGA